MKTRKPGLMIGCVCILILVVSFGLVSRDKVDTVKKDISSTGRVTPKEETRLWLDWKLWITLLALVFGLYQYLRRKKDEKEKKIAQLEGEKEFREKEFVCGAKTAEDIYGAALKEELGTIHLFGSPDIESPAVKLEDAFISLRISESWRSDNRYCLGQDGNPGIMEIERDRIMDREMAGEERHLTPEEAMKRAFQKYRILMVVGDPGSGKTTLLKYYAVGCLDKTSKKWERFGFKEAVMPVYFPLRELRFDENGTPFSLTQSLTSWCDNHLLNITADQFHYWLQKRKTLVLLDGLDEIYSSEQRKRVCRWIKEMCAGLGNAYFVVTSRSTGYRKSDDIELEMPHLRADIMDFSSRQQEEFLKKWFLALFLSGLPPKGMLEFEWKAGQKKRAALQSHKIIEFLKKEENKSVRELAAVPMLLQIMAIIWKEHTFLPRSRSELYDTALNYLLDLRDRHRGIEPLLSANDSRRVLAPAAMWMHEVKKRDEAPKHEMHQIIRGILKTLKGQHKPETFCEYIRDRAGLIADYDRDHYIFRHKSFREFLVALQLEKESRDKNRIKTVVRQFKNEWWEEPIRFFMSESSDKIFDSFMREFFQSDVSLELNDHHQNLLLDLVREARQKTAGALAECLNSALVKDNRRRYVLDCLKTIGTPEAFETIKNAPKENWDESIRTYAQDILAEVSAHSQEPPVRSEPVDLRLQNTFRNPFEDNVEYIKVPGGSYIYSVSEKVETVPDLYFCKYPVTNKRYNRFIAYLEGKEKELERIFPLKMYLEKLPIFSESIPGFREWLGKNRDEWKEKLRSRIDDKKFLGDDQPVVCVTWFSARAYCSWLSCMEASKSGDKKMDDMGKLSGIYRLPTEVEWEWAAGGEPVGPVKPVREFPWPKEKGEPSVKLANYGGNVGTTTPVGRYPDGATPLGLMDMAGNVWEWMANYWDEKTKAPALRGGSWLSNDGNLRCSARSYLYPDCWDGNSYGFRVVRSQLF